MVGSERGDVVDTAQRRCHVGGSTGRDRVGARVHGERRVDESGVYGHGYGEDCWLGESGVRDVEGVTDISLKGFQATGLKREMGD